MKNKEYTKEEEDKIRVELKKWQNNPNRKYTNGILEKVASLVFKDPTKGMSLVDKQEFK